MDEQISDSPLKTYVRMSGPLSVVDPALAEHVLAVIREGVSNAVRHAHALTMTLSVTVGNDLAVEVVDDGVGLPEGITPSGLSNLGQRARELGGEMTLTPGESGRGLALRWSVPL